jgi:hypothetical protein
MGRKYVFIIPLFLMFTLLCTPYLSTGENEKSVRESILIEKVTQLGLTDENPLDQIVTIHKDAYLAAPLLLKELKLIAPYNMQCYDLNDLDKTAMHVIWCIRALRSITGKQFAANTETIKKVPIQEYLGKRNPLPFFTEWMSRAKIYVAPQDVQKKIIKKWKVFLEKNPNFQIRKYNFWEDDDWYF